MRTLVCNDIFNGVLQDGDVLCIPSNGQLTTDGKMVMGAGFAARIRSFLPAIDVIAGKQIRNCGNDVNYLGEFNIDNQRIHIYTFPTKHHWKDDSDLNLIERSALRLVDEIDAMDCFTGKIFIPAPGCGCGKLEWDDVDRVISRTLHEDKYVITAQSNIFKQKGILQLVNLTKLHEIDWQMYPDKRLFIVRKVTSNAVSAVKKWKLQEVPQLSPSAQLFSAYYRWKEGKFTKDEINELTSKSVSPMLPDAWWYLYTPRFIAEMQTRPDLIKCMKRTLELLDSGINVAMVCYCPKPERCHRGIIGAVIQERGYTVIFK